MVCVYCASPTRVTNSRLQRRENHIWRRRACLACTNIFTTKEQPELAGALVVKGRTGGLEPFNRDKLFLTIHQTCEHRENPINDATMLTTIIISDLMAQAKDGVLERASLINTAHKILKRVEPTAAALYLAYHPLPQNTASTS